MCKLPTSVLLSDTHAQLLMTQTILGMSRQTESVLSEAAVPPTGVPFSRWTSVIQGEARLTNQAPRLASSANWR